MPRFDRSHNGVRLSAHTCASRSNRFPKVVRIRQSIGHIGTCELPEDPCSRRTSPWRMAAVRWHLPSAVGRPRSAHLPEPDRRLLVCAARFIELGGAANADVAKTTASRAKSTRYGLMVGLLFSSLRTIFLTNVLLIPHLRSEYREPTSDARKGTKRDNLVRESQATVGELR